MSNLTQLIQAQTLVIKDVQGVLEELRDLIKENNRYNQDYHTLINELKDIIKFQTSYINNIPDLTIVFFYEIS